MRVAELIDSRTPLWRKLEALCAQLESRGARRKLGAHRRSEFAALYRAACADLALADAHQLPAETVRYLHQLVGRAHNQLYRARGANVGTWWAELFERTPRRLFHDNALRVAAALFWGAFIASMYLASSGSPYPEYAEAVLTRDYMMQMENMYADPPWAQPRGAGGNMQATGFYIFNNAGIGLRCFAMGLILGVGGLFATAFNAVLLGAVFGHMLSTPQRDNFIQFVTAHGPFELTAIVLSAAAGMRLGFAVVSTGGRRRGDALLAAARRAMPIMFAGVILFLLAAVIEAFVSPSPLPYWVKAFVAILSTMLLLGYLVVLGYSAQADEAEDERLAVE